MRETACRRCKALSQGKVCPNCGSTDLTPDWSGLVIITNPERSQIAKILSIDKSGRYALKVT